MALQRQTKREGYQANIPAPRRYGRATRLARQRARCHVSSVKSFFTQLPSDVPGVAMPIFKVLVPTEDAIRTSHAIEHEGSFWIVPGWYVQKSTGLQKPARIVRVDHIRRLRVSPTLGADFALFSPVPNILFDCSIAPTQDAGFDVRDSPPIVLNSDGSPSDKQ